MKRTVFTLVILLTVLTSLVSACSPKPAGTTEPTQASVPEQGQPTQSSEITSDNQAVEIRWFIGLGTGDDPAQVESEKKIVEQFNAEHPNIKLVMEVVNYNGARDALATEIASGNPPDIVGPVGVSGAEAFHGQWLDLTSLVEKTKYDLDQFDKGAVDFYRVGGEGLIGLPFAIFPSMLYYQRDMFDEAGLNYPPHKYGEKYKWADGTEVEWNYDTLRELAMKLTVDKNGKDATNPSFDPQNISQYGYEPQYQDPRAVGGYFKAGSLVADDGKTAQIPDAWADSWHWLYDGVWNDHYIPNDAVRQSSEYNSGNPFNSGKVAMALTHLWYTCCLVDAGQNWDMAVVPSYIGTTTANFNADTFRILKDTKHPDEAFEVVTYLIGPASLELLDIYEGMPARKTDQEAFFKTLDEQFPQEVDWQVAVDGIAYADNPNFEAYMPNYNEAFDRINTFFTLITSTEGLDLDKEIDTLKSDLQVIFDKAD